MGGNEKSLKYQKCQCWYFHSSFCWFLAFLLALFIFMAKSATCGRSSYLIRSCQGYSGVRKWLKIAPNGVHAENVHNGSLSKCISFQHDCFGFISSCKRVVVTCKDARIMQKVFLEHSRAVQGAKRRLMNIFQPNEASKGIFELNLLEDSLYLLCAICNSI